MVKENFSLTTAIPVLVKSDSPLSKGIPAVLRSAEDLVKKHEIYLSEFSIVATLSLKAGAKRFALSK